MPGFPTMDQNKPTSRSICIKFCCLFSHNICRKCYEDFTTSLPTGFPKYQISWVDCPLIMWRVRWDLARGPIERETFRGIYEFFNWLMNLPSPTPLCGNHAPANLWQKGNHSLHYYGLWETLQFVHSKNCLQLSID